MNPTSTRRTTPARPGTPWRILANGPHGTAATGARPLGLYDSATARAVETRALAALPAYTLMQRAGAAVAALARAVKPHARQVLVLAGPGNNGGDGYEAALQLHQIGYRVTVVTHGDDARLPVDAGTALARARQGGVVIRPAGDSAWSTAGDFGPDDLVIDALLGRGLSRAVTGEIAQVIAYLNHLALDVLAVDLPSGLPSDTGWLDSKAGSPCVKARWTLALLSLAPGLWMAQGRDQAGEIWFDDLGVADPGLAPQAGLTLGPARPSTRNHASNKGSFGDVWVVGGATGMIGAVALAARAALHAGAGRVFLQAQGSDAPSLDTQAPELMMRPSTSPPSTQAGSGSDPGADVDDDSHAPADPMPASPSARELSAATVVAGCGGGTSIAARLPGLIEHSHRLVLDADALNAIAASVELQQAVRHRSARGVATVITPHPLEAARLLGSSAADVQANRLAAARALVDRFGCAVVLKGSGSVVMAPGLTPGINPSGSAALSTPGSGDVLAGWLGGWWSQAGRTAEAQPEASAWASDALSACTYAVWSHGRAAELASPAGLALPAGELVLALGSGLRSGLF
ncbi:MAG: NAD(P)H-hydrate epimerase [Burkholderiales bacterium]|nr:NAD(P)H-hydrate epimerase [Burkholderiales bacterium]